MLIRQHFQRVPIQTYLVYFYLTTTITIAPLSDRLTECVDNNKKIPTNSIAAHPADDNVFLLSCIDKYVRVYDRRMIGSERQAYRRLCPHRLVSGDTRIAVPHGLGETRHRLYSGIGEGFSAYRLVRDVPQTVLHGLER